MNADVKQNWGGGGYCKMLFNEVKLKPGVFMEQVEMALGEMCNVVPIQRAARRQLIMQRLHRRHADALVGQQGIADAEHEDPHESRGSA